MTTHFSDYVRCLCGYAKLAGLSETCGLLGSIIALKAGAVPKLDAQRAMQRWAFFQSLALEPGTRVSRVEKSEFRVSYAGQKVEFGAVEVALRVPDCDSSDSRVFEQVIIAKDYAQVMEWFSAVSPGGEIHTIMDIGANIGCSALFFCIWLPAPDIFCLEPEASNFTRLLLNLSLNPTRHIRCHRAALWTRPGSLECSHDFRDGKEWGARFVQAQTGGQTSLQAAPAIDITGVAEKAGFAHVDFLKMDIEGTEADLFRSPLFCAFLEEKVFRLAVEVHEEFIKVNEVHAILNSLGFKTKTISEFVCAAKIRLSPQNSPA